MDSKNAKRLIGSREDETDDSEIKSLWLDRRLCPSDRTLTTNCLCVRSLPNSLLLRGPSLAPRFPNFVWERICPRNSVALSRNDAVVRERRAATDQLAAAELRHGR